MAQKKPVKQIIEDYPEIGIREMGWYKSREGIRPAGIERTEHEVTAAIPAKVDKSAVHTHTLKTGRPVPIGHALPSVKDLRKCANEIKLGHELINHVASLDAEGRVMGYVTFKPTRHFRTVAAEMGENFVIALHEKFGKPEKINFVWHLLRQELIRLKARPMPGYVFNSEKGRFEPKEP